MKHLFYILREIKHIPVNPLVSKLSVDFASDISVNEFAAIKDLNPIDDKHHKSTAACIFMCGTFNNKVML